ncbi:MAG: prepilin-type N-terminal cleavage/methylation domain-containing protein [Endomicrobium sp.]|jgi:Tfp pilus assembly protein PilE|nr:prepilin-type N-terminal cleavage/methylation domain-containing protein [Endomicrobium sp.]
MVKSKGFTLVEFIIIVAIVCALSVVAIPVYKKYIEKTKIFPKSEFIEKL